MYKEKRGALTALDSYIDMLINLVAVLVGYLFAVMIRPEAEAVRIFHPVTASLIFLNILAYLQFLLVLH